MNSHTLLGLLAERDRLRHERDQYRAECHAMRALTFLLAVTVVVTLATNSWVAVVVAGLCMLCGLFLASLCWAAHRGDEAMGIGDTQGRTNLP